MKNYLFLAKTGDKNMSYIGSNVMARNLAEAYHNINKTFGVFPTVIL